MNRESYEDFYDRNWQQAIYNIRETYEPSEDEIADEVSDMYEGAWDDYCDQVHEQQRDDRDFGDD